MVRLRICKGIICFILLFHIVFADRQCDISDLTVNNTCSETELCDSDMKSCQCLPGHERKNSTYCAPKNILPSQSTPNYSSLVDNKGSGSIIAGILIPVCLIIFIVSGIYMNRKYKILTWARNKINRRTENYDEFMIGQDVDDDDPPLH